MWYLPRLLIYHSAAPVGGEASETFKVMERRLLKAIGTPAMIATLLFGILLATAQAQWADGWLHQAAACPDHGRLPRLLARDVRVFAGDGRPRSERFYRVFNEVPTILFIGIVFLAILKPFIRPRRADAALRERARRERRHRHPPEAATEQVPSPNRTSRQSATRRGVAVNACVARAPSSRASTSRRWRSPTLSSAAAARRCPPCRSASRWPLWSQRLLPSRRRRARARDRPRADGAARSRLRAREAVAQRDSASQRDRCRSAIRHRLASTPGPPAGAPRSGRTATIGTIVATIASSVASRSTDDNSAEFDFARAGALRPAAARDQSHRAEAPLAGRALKLGRGTRHRCAQQPEEGRPVVRGARSGWPRPTCRSPATGCSRSCRTGLASCARRTSTTWPARTTSTCRRRRSGASACAPATWSRAWCGRPRRASATSRSCAPTRSISTRRSRRGTGCISTTSRPTTRPRS